MIAFVFPGQGSQVYRMGEFILQDMPSLKKYYDEANEVLGRNIYESIFGDRSNFLTNPLDIQPAIYITGYAAYKYFEAKYNCAPSYMAGHSLGEITALAASGVYTYTDGLRISDKRGQLMEEGCRRHPGVMTSIYEYNSELVKSYCEQINSRLLSVAAVNSRTQLVLSGGLQEIESAEKYFEGRGARIKRLNTIGAFHSPAMEEASKALKEFLDEIPLGQPRIPVISNVTAKEYANRQGVTDLLKRLLTQTVQWESIVSYFESHFVDTVVDAGPGVVMKNIINSDKRKSKAYSLDIAEDRSVLFKILKKQEAFTHHHYSELIRLCLCTAASTPALVQPVDTSNAMQLYREISDLQEMAASAFYADSLVQQLTEKMALLLKCKGYSTDQVNKVMDHVLMEAGVLHN